jgi:hypothetical protein
LPIRFNLQYQAEGAAEEQALVAANKDKAPKIELMSEKFEKDEWNKREFTW